MNDSKTVVVSNFPALLGSVMAMRRKEINLTQEDLGNALGMNASSWSRIERGETAINIDQLFTAAETLKIKASELIERTEKNELFLKEKGVKVLDRAAFTTIVKATAAGAALGPIGLVGTGLYQFLKTSYLLSQKNTHNSDCD